MAGIGRLAESLACSRKHVAEQTADFLESAGREYARAIEENPGAASLAIGTLPFFAVWGVARLESAMSPGCALVRGLRAPATVGARRSGMQ